MTSERWIDPEMAVVLNAMPTLIGDLSDEALPSMRANRLALTDAVVLSEEVERADHTVPGPDGAPDIVLRVHRPRDLAGTLPCIYSIHGGGYILGTYEMEDLRFDRWCTKLGCVGVAVEYRLAPETPYPGPLEDCYAGLRWVHDHADELGIDPARTGITGASAGGGRPPPWPCSPATAASCPSPSSSSSTR